MKKWLSPLILASAVAAGLASLTFVNASEPNSSLLRPAPRPADLTRPAPIPPALVNPGRQEWRNQLDVLLIEDKHAGTQYLSTLSSSGSVLPGSQPQAIFGARMPREGAKKVATWYTHKPEKEVQEITQLQPAQAFRGMADHHGVATSLGGDSFRPVNGRQVNPVLSEMAFDAIAKAAPGTSRELSLVERLSSGAERKLITQVSKRAHLVLSSAPTNSCRTETVEGVSGKLCVLRTISGESNTSSGGDLMFTVRAKMIQTPTARFRVGKQWLRMNESVPIASFAQAEQIEVFFVPPSLEQVENFREQNPKLRLSQLVEAGFYSASRLQRGDRFNIQLLDAGSLDKLNRARQAALGRLHLLTVIDEVSSRQYVTTLRSNGGQSIYGVDQPQQGERPAAWYLENAHLPGLNGLTRATAAQPVGLFNGWINSDGSFSQGRTVPQPGQVNPVFSAGALASLKNMPLGGNKLLGLDGESRQGERLQYKSLVSQSAVLRLKKPATASACHVDKVQGVEGQVCVLRKLDWQAYGDSSGMASIQLASKAPPPGALIKTNSGWKRFSEPHSLSAFKGISDLEVFSPGNMREKSQIFTLLSSMQLEIYPDGRKGGGDIFLVNGFDTLVRVDMSGFRYIDNGIVATGSSNTGSSGMKELGGVTFAGKDQLWVFRQEMVGHPYARILNFTKVNNTLLPYHDNNGVSITEEVQLGSSTSASVYMGWRTGFGDAVTIFGERNFVCALNLKVCWVYDYFSCNSYSSSCKYPPGFPSTRPPLPEPEPPIKIFQVVSVSDAEVPGGNVAEVGVLLRNIPGAPGVSGQPNMYVHVVLDNAAVADVNLKQVTIKNYNGTSRVIDLSSQRPTLVTMPDNTSLDDRMVRLLIPTNKVSEDKSFKVHVDVSSAMDKSKTGGVKIKTAPFEVVSVSDAMVDGGEPAEALVLTHGGATGKSLYLQAKLDNALAADVVLANVKLSFDDGSSKVVNLSSLQPLTVAMPAGVDSKVKVTIPTRVVMEDKSFKLLADSSVAMDKAFAGTITIVAAKTVEISGGGKPAIAGVDKLAYPVSLKANAWIAPLWLKLNGNASEGAYDGANITVRSNDGQGTIACQAINADNKWARCDVPASFAKSAWVEVPTRFVADNKGKQSKVTLMAALDSKEPSIAQSQATGVIYTPTPTFAITPASASSGSAKGTVGHVGGVAKLDYVIKLQANDLPPVESGKSGSVRAYLANRGLGTVKAVLSLTNDSGQTGAADTCRFALQNDAKRGIAVPAKVQFMAGGVSQSQADNCSGVQHDLTKADWLDDGSNPQAGMRASKLPLSILFPMDDPRSHQVIEDKGPWQGSAIGKGKVQVDLGLEPGQ